MQINRTIFFKAFFISTFAILAVSCTVTKVPPHIEAADKITNPFISNAKKDHKLLVLGTGGAMMDQVEYIFVSFIAYGEYDIAESREHYLKIVEPFVENIKNSQELRTYLLHPNEPEKAAHINITYRDSTHRQPYPPKIAHITMGDGILRYSVSDSPTSPYRTIHQETYQEALHKVTYSN